MRHTLLTEGKPSWWMGRASNPVGGAMRCWVGSTPIPLRRPRLACDVDATQDVAPEAAVIGSGFESTERAARVFRIQQ